MKYFFYFILLLSFSSIYAELKFYSRLGDLPVNADVYRIIDSEVDVFVDANSLPPAYRSRITKNIDVYEKVDMGQVKKGQVMSTNGTVSYEKEWHAKDDSELYQVKGKETLIDITHSSEEVKSKVLNNKDIFTPIGKAKEISQEKKDLLTMKIEQLLKDVIGETDEAIKVFGTYVVYQAFQTLEQEIFTFKGKLLPEFERELNTISKSGDLSKIKDFKNQKQSFEEFNSISYFLNHKSTKFQKLARDFQKSKTKSYELLNTSIQKERAEQLNLGNVEIVDMIDQKLKEVKQKVALEHFLDHRVLFSIRPNSNTIEKLVFEKGNQVSLYDMNQQKRRTGYHTTELGKFPLKIKWPSIKGFMNFNSMEDGIMKGNSKAGPIIGTSSFSHLYESQQADIVKGKWNVENKKNKNTYTIEIKSDHLAVKTSKVKSKTVKTNGYWYCYQDKVKIFWVNNQWMNIDLFSKSKCQGNSKAGPIELNKPRFSF